MEVRVVVGRYAADQCVVAFRGSKTLYNYFIEITRFTLTPYVKCDGCEVEAGFQEIWQSLRDSLFGTLARLCTGRSLHITGHSLGSAIAQLAFLETDFPVASLYAFAAPRVGNPAFASAVGAKGGSVARSEAWHVVHYRDLVPHIPTFHIMGYAHGLRSVSCMTENSCADATYDFCAANDHKCGFEKWPLHELTPTEHCHYLDTVICYCKGIGQLASSGSEVVLV